MKSTIESLLGDLSSKLETVMREAVSPIDAAERSIFFCKESLSLVKQAADARISFTTEDEIWYFKEAAPEIFGLLIYFSQVFRFESRRGIAGSSLEKKQVTDLLTAIEGYLAANHDLYSYYHAKARDFDELLFTPGKPQLYLLEDDETLMIDARYCTPAGFKIAKFKAYERLQGYLLRDDPGAEVKVVPGSSTTVKAMWTDQKSGLIELVYALHASGSVDHGKATVRDIATIFERALHVDLSNYYRAMQNMRIRKINRTKFLDLLKENLEKRMDETDEWGR